MMIRCQCGYEAGYIEFLRGDLPKDLMRKIEYQGGRVAFAPRYRCNACGCVWQIIVGQDQRPAVEVICQPRAAA